MKKRAVRVDVATDFVAILNCLANRPHAIQQVPVLVAGAVRRSIGHVRSMGGHCNRRY